MSTSAWVRRLSSFATFSHDELNLLEQLGGASRQYATQDGLVKAGDPADRIFVVLEGLACQFKLLPDGRRQILAYLFPGDMCDPRHLLAPRWNHAMCVLWPARIAALTLESVQRLERYPNIAAAISRYSMMQQSIGREWLVNVGHRTAYERVSHLLCEFYTRLKAVGLTTDDSFELPLTQAELGDTLALSAVHINRTLMELRRLRIVTFLNRQAVIHDYGALRAAAGFDPGYLQLDTEPGVPLGRD
ncbi:MAG TPA: Crp/Fnr family transcriptional regulator [Steroidobacteraceae bacterium]|nr:Crp/Fnr family transcriptional regulator [Steroidobacteraceae bacterium]